MRTKTGICQSLKGAKRQTKSAAQEARRCHIFNERDGV
jgi:hypothetical protein